MCGKFSEFHVVVVALADVVALVVGETCYMHQLVGMGGQYQQVTEIGNNIILPCDQFCPQTPLSLQGHAFTVNFHILPISDADIALGIQ